MELKMALEKQLSNFSNPYSHRISHSYHNIIYFPFDFKKQWPVVETNGNQVPPQQVQGRISLSPLNRSLANIAGNMWLWLKMVPMTFPIYFKFNGVSANCYISIYLYIPILILFRYIYTPLGYSAVLWTRRDFLVPVSLTPKIWASQWLQMWQPNFDRSKTPALRMWYKKDLVLWSIRYYWYIHNFGIPLLYNLIIV